MKIDSHQHFWRYDPVQYDWIDESMARIRRDFLPTDLAPLLAAGGMEGCVAVEARQSVEETDWLLSLAREFPFIRGVVGWAPLAGPGLEAHLERWSGVAALKGMRHVVQGEPDPAFLERPAFNDGIRALTRFDLAYDLLVLAHQLPATIAFVDRHPNQRFVLDHIAKPVVQGSPPAEWSRLLHELARRPNVLCKFSGVVTEVPGWSWTPELLRPYFETALDAFGASRLMFGSDWPVCLVAAGYAAWRDFVDRAVSRLSAAERAAILGGNATRFYRLA